MALLKHNTREMCMNMTKFCDGFAAPKVLWMALAITAVACSDLRTGQAASGSSIRIGLRTQGGPIALYCRFPVVLTDAKQPGRKMTARAGDIVSFSLGQSTSIPAGAKKWTGPVTVRIGNSESPAWQVVRARPNGSPTAVSSNGQTPRYQRAYRGSFEIAPQTYTFDAANHKSNLRLVNMVPLDEYLAGVVPWEMTASAPYEALKAQAICARSETLAKIDGGRHAKDGYEICDYDHCQGYAGTENESAASTRAVLQTSGFILMHNRQIVDAVYATNSGGVTANARDVWSGAPKTYLQSVRDYSPTRHPAMATVVRRRMSESDWANYCSRSWPSYAQPTPAQIRTLTDLRRRSPQVAALFGPQDLPEFYRWTRAVSPYALAKVLSARAPNDPAISKTQKALLAKSPLTMISEIRVSERAPLGHIKRLTVAGRTKSGASVPIVFSGDSQIRGLLSGRLGSTQSLPSSTFVIVPRRDARRVLAAFVLKGAGWGHGVGMCQRGAQTHARDGWTARQILKFYYRGVDLTKAY